MFTRMIAGLAGLLIVFALAGTASAAPLSASIKADTTDNALVQMVHGCHRDVQRGVAGPHYHAGPGCRRIAVGGGRGYGGYGPRRRGYCRDVRTCRYVGPIKQCRTRTVCD